MTVAELIDRFTAHYEVLVGSGQTSRKTLDWYAAALDKLRAKAG